VVGSFIGLPLSINDALGTYYVGVLLALKALISRFLDLHSVDDLHWDHGYDILPQLRVQLMLGGGLRPMDDLWSEQVLI
jgi:hypothetical protein